MSRDLDTDQVLLVERNPALRFMGGYHAFPGGTLDPEDSEITVQNVVVPEGEDPTEFDTFVVAAVRELFEETGVLFAHGGPLPTEDKLSNYRQQLLDGKIQWSEILSREGLHLDARDFRPLCRISTPPFIPRGYDAWFFLCELPKEQSVTIWEGELVNGSFRRASDALTEWRRGELLIVPPVRLLLRLLEDKPDNGYHDVVKDLTSAYARGKLHRVRFNPGILIAPLKSPTLPPATHTNCYLIGDRSIYIIDPAATEASEQEKLWELLDEFIGEGRKLEAIILTHNHADHIASAQPAKKRYGIPLLAHAETIRMLPDLEFDDEITHQAVLPLGNSPDGKPGWEMIAYHTPGHARGHLIFKENRYHSVIAGDLVSTLSSIIVDPDDGHLTTYMGSLRVLAELSDATVYPAHGPPAREGRQLVQRAIDHREEREGQIFAALAGSAQTTQELLPKAYADVEPNFYHVAERALISGLIKLVEDGHAIKNEQGYMLA